MKNKKTAILKVLLLLLPLAAIFFLVTTIPQVRKIITRAFARKANIIVNTEAIMGDLPQPWKALAQGGEEKENILSPVIGEIADLEPDYIRIDHIFDFYNVVDKSNNQLVFDFQKLDRLVDDILKTGAKPFFSLSFMPPIVAAGDVVSAPHQWSDWQLIVKKTIEHYSGYQEKNIKDVYYGVWSEPDLFGQWKIWGEKNYLDLYFWAAKGAEEAKEVNSFKFGGPATADFYPNWIESLVKLAEKENLKLDFVSWHSYHLDPEKFARDLEKVEKSIKKVIGNRYLEKIISEWGSDSEINPVHDTQFDAAHEIAVLRSVSGKARFAFSFEIKDGLSPEGKKFWGRWGMLTHESFGVFKKPRYWSRILLTHLGGQKLYLTGENYWIKGIAAKNEGKMALILANFDPDSKHQETFPVSFENLTNGDYLVRKTSLNNEVFETEIKVENGSYQEQVYLAPNQVLLIELYYLLK